MSAPPGVILAGGQATRMGGGDKGLLVLGCGVILDHVIARLGPQVRAMALKISKLPSEVSGALGAEVRDMQLGATHLALHTAEGRVFTFGSGTALGLAKVRVRVS